MGLSVAAAIGKISFVVFLLLILLMNLIGLPGNWIILALAVIYDAVTHFNALGWPVLLVLLILAVIGEIVESFVGLVYVARRGASGLGVLGVFVGTILGAIAGTSVLPIAGTILGALLGAAIGGILFEYLRARSMDKAVRAGQAALIGRALATLEKYLLGMVMVAIIAWRLLTG